MFTNKQIDEDELRRKLRKKLFWALVLTGCIANMIGFLSNAVMFGISVGTVLSGVCVIVMIVCGAVGIVLQKQKTAESVIVLMLALIEFSFLFYLYGANMGVYLILGVIGLAVYFPRPYHVPAIIVTILLDVFVIILSYLYSGTSEKMARETQLGTMLCSYLIVAVAAAIIISNLISQYRLQQKQILQVSSELEYAAHRDALTGVYNRGYLINILNQWTNMKHKHFLAALIDIDDFKKINDTYGHVYGDEVLIELARLMRQEIHEIGIVARYGGEEFMFLFENPNRKAAMEVLERIRVGLREYSMKTRKIVITFSGGIEEYQTDGKIDELLRKADQKLYQAKNNGKDQVIF